MTARVTIEVPGPPVAKGRPRFRSLPTGAVQRKATDEQLLKSYERTGSVWKTASEFKMCGQSVHERLVKLKANHRLNVFTVDEKEILRNKYERYTSIGMLPQLAVEMNRTKYFLCRQAKKLGLTNNRRPRDHGQSARIIQSERTKAWLRINEHPRGMSGKRHTEKTKKALSISSRAQFAAMTESQIAARTLKIMKTKNANGTMIPLHRKTSWKAGWRTINNKRYYFRSSWEANYGRYLEWLKTRGEIIGWEHEPQTFWFEGVKRGTCSYLPDFRVIERNDKIVFHEVKGWMDARSKTKLKRMKKYYPEVRLIVINGKDYHYLASQVRRLIAGWE